MFEFIRLGLIELIKRKVCTYLDRTTQKVWNFKVPTTSIVSKKKTKMAIKSDMKYLYFPKLTIHTMRLFVTSVDLHNKNNEITF